MSLRISERYLWALSVMHCNAPRPELQVSSMISGFRRVIHFGSLHHVYCIMSSCHKSFASQLNKLHGSSIHLNRGNSHGDSLYNISSRYLESYSTYSNYLDLPQTHLQNNSMYFILQVWSPNFANNFFHRFPVLHKNSEHFWTLQKCFPNSNLFESHSNVFNCNPSKRCQMYFSWIKLLFMSLRKLAPCSNSSPISLCFFLFLGLFVFQEIKEK